ncbi:MAG: TIR domain-containing protein [Lentisphaeria bacterium]|nr:TIR domain-containing protein [Lentisphaeria bacterium]
MSDVFISYSSKDKDIAFQICKDLELGGISCWIAPRDIPVGSEYASGIMKGIEDCSCFLLIFSESSNSSRHVLTELENAFSHNKVIFPYMISETIPSDSMQYFLKMSQWLTAYKQNSKDSLIELKSGLSSVIGGVHNEETSSNIEVLPVEKKQSISKLFFITITVLILVLVCFLFPMIMLNKKDSKVYEENPWQTTLETFKSRHEGNLPEKVKNHLSMVETLGKQMENESILVSCSVEPEQDIYFKDEKIVFDTWISQDAFIAIYVYSIDGSCTLIYPKLGEPLSRVPKNKKISIGRDDGFTFTIAEPFGLDFIHIVAFSEKEKMDELLSQATQIPGTSFGSVSMENQLSGLRGIKMTKTAPSYTALPPDQQTRNLTSKWGQNFLLIRTKEVK